MRYCEACGEPLPENAALNRKLCAACGYKAYRSKANAYQRKRYQKYKEKISAEAKETREWYKAKGICVKCRKEKAAEGHTMCQQCLDWWREYSRNREKRKKA